MATPTWAYFNTAARVWELGVGALLATAVNKLARIPSKAKPWLAWTGLGIIAASLFLITENSGGFPAPWALLPVGGAALVIVAGVGGEPRHLRFLQNRLSVYVGDISYSLYLVHWPVIVILATLMPRNAAFYIVAVAFAFGLAIGSYHFVENPLRHGNWRKARQTMHEIRRRRYRPRPSSRYAALATLSLVSLAFAAYAMRPVIHHQIPPSVPAVKVDPSDTKAKSGPLTSTLQVEIAQALTATEWPPLNPSMESAIENDTGVPTDFTGCGSLRDNFDDPNMCTWGSPSARTRVVIVGDSIARTYAWPLRQIALHSEGQIQVHLASVGGCQFVDAPIYNPDESITAICPDAKQREVDYINSAKPDVVVISNLYSQNKPLVGGGNMRPGDYSKALNQIIEKFRSSTKKVVLLSATPVDKNPQECFSNRSSVPADCISKVQPAWLSQAREEQNVAHAVGGTWIDSRPWFCNDAGYCPSFVGSTPVKHNTSHMGFAYGEKIYPVVEESLTAAGVFGPLGSTDSSPSPPP